MRILLQGTSVMRFQRSSNVTQVLTLSSSVTAGVDWLVGKRGHGKRGQARKEK